MKKAVNRAALVRYLTEELESCENFLMEKAHAKSRVLNEVLEIPADDLPTHINSGGLKEELVNERLKGNDIDTPLWHTRVLYDEEFDYEDYKALGVNDGELRVIGRVFQMLGKEELETRAANAMYTNNY
jgi:hypothetical protein